jgi:fumarate reductase flavoprotein subunit
MAMKLNGPEFFNTDVLTIGSGGAGLRAAIAAREKGAEVTLVSKSPVGLGNNTALVMGAMASATSILQYRGIFTCKKQKGR